MIAVITATAALVFVCCLLRAAILRWRSESIPTRRHRRAWRQPPTPTLQHALATAGTHGLGMVKKGTPS